MNQMKLKQQKNSQGDIMNQRLIAEIKNLQDNNKVLEECLKDRQKTISQLKNTLKIIGGGAQDEINFDDNEEGNLSLAEKKKRLEEIMNDTKKKEKQLDEIKKNYMDMINMKEEKIKQLKEKLGY